MYSKISSQLCYLDGHAIFEDARLIKQIYKKEKGGNE